MVIECSIAHLYVAEAFKGVRDADELLGVSVVGGAQLFQRGLQLKQTLREDKLGTDLAEVFVERFEAHLVSRF